MGGRRQILWAVVVTACGVSVPLAVHANDCETTFECRIDGVSRYINLRALRDKHKSNRWIQDNCRVFHADEGCNWRTSSGEGPSRARYVPPSGGTYAAPADDSGTVGPGGALPARRDVWGKRVPAPAPPRDDPAATAFAADDGPYSAEIGAAALRYKIPAALIRAVMQVESGGNPTVVSNKGAVGLMQLLPATAQAMHVTDLRDAAQNIMGGARFLRLLANRFQGDLVKVLSAYHAGSVRVVSRDATPFAATDNYVRTVLKTYYQLRDASLRP